jgi:hypothetical protein
MTEISKTFAVDLKSLAERLESCDEIRRYDTAGEKQAWTLAHNLIDLEESCRAFVEKLLPRLKSENLSPEQINDLLLEMGEEFRHMLYHIQDPEFFAYLRGPGTESGH